MSPTRATGNIIAEALSVAPVERDAKDIAILKATLRCLTRFGMERMTVEDVAKAAGVGRATVFRRFETKDDLIRQAFALELQRLAVEFEEKAGAIDDPYERLVEFCLDSVRIVRTHPVARRLIEDDDALALHRDPRIAEFQLAGLRRYLDAAAAELGVDTDTEMLAELLMRFFGSVWLAPEIGTAVADEGTLRRMVTMLLAPLTPESQGA
ncbi:TetR/AcrR family transcriptional regulator [Mycolicibacterium celeriflavum]|uniref:TetR/AcrR family transcriptional regulator n=1 Tax=Mycolicibacterium celeriflavum TaxID=1249101 RepID=UPI003CF79F08